MSLFVLNTGSLGQVTSGLGGAHTLPPSETQLTCCAEELSKLSSLLQSGAMDPLPNDDGVLIKILRKALALNSQRRYEKITSQLSMLSKTLIQKDSKLIFKAWRESDLSLVTNDAFRAAESLTALLHIDLLEMNHSHDSSFFSLGPSSEVLKSVINLFDEWNQRMPRKKARRSRFGDVLLSFVNTTLKDAESITSSRRPATDNVGDDFAQHFAKSNANENHSKESFATSTLCEGLVYLFIFSQSGRTTTSAECDNSFPLQHSLQFCEKVRVGIQIIFISINNSPLFLICCWQIWSIIADDRMKMHRLHLMEKGTILEEDTQAKSSPFSVYLSMKLFSSLMIQFLHQLKNETSESVKSKNDVLQNEEYILFILSCIEAGIISACEYIESPNIRITTPVSFSSPVYGHESRRKSNILTCGLIWMSCIIHEMNQLLCFTRSTFATHIRYFEKAVDHCVPRFIDIAMHCLKKIHASEGEKETLGSCYRACLAMLRNTVNAFIIRYHKHAINVPQEDVDELKASSNDSVGNEFDEFGDELFLALDLDQTGGNQSISDDRSESVFNYARRQDLWAQLLMAINQGKVREKTF